MAEDIELGRAAGVRSVGQSDPLEIRMAYARLRSAIEAATRMTAIPSYVF